MPRIRNIFDYNTEDKIHRPKETLIDVPMTDSVGVITLHFEHGGFVQLQRIDPKDEDSHPNEWMVITNLDVVKQKKGSVAGNGH